MRDKIINIAHTIQMKPPSAIRTILTPYVQLHSRYKLQIYTQNYTHEIIYKLYSTKNTNYIFKSIFIR
jgi:hypothetical protein